MTEPGLRYRSSQGRWVLLAAVLGSALAGIDATVVNVALPSIGRDLNVGFASLQWTVTGYGLTLASLVLLAGALADQYGRRRVFVIGVIWFAAASLLCGLAPTAQLLIGARLLQGIGAALLTPGSLAMIQASFTPEDRGRAIGSWAAFGGIATAIGPFVGGWLIQVASWRWIFLINPPLAVIVVLVALRHVPESRNPAVTQVDFLGAVLGVLGLGGLTYAIIEVPSRGATDAGVLAAAVIGVVSLGAFLLTEAHHRHPMLPLSVFSSHQFSATNAVTFLIYSALGGVFFFLVVQLQVVAGFSPVAAGTSLLPITLIMLAFSSRGGGLAQRIGPRLPMTLGTLVCAFAGLLMLRIGPGANYLLDVLPPVAIFGCGLALLVAPLTSTVLAALDVRLAGTASGVNNAVARTAGLIAVAALPAVAGLRGRDYDDPAAFNDAFRMVVFVCVALLALAALLTACTIADDAAVRRARAVPDHGVLRLEPGVVTPEPAERIPLPHCAIAVPFPATPNQPSPGDPPGPKQASWS